MDDFSDVEIVCAQGKIPSDPINLDSDVDDIEDFFLVGRFR